MKFILAVITTIIIAFIVQYFQIGPWWSLAVVTLFLGALMGFNSLKSFLFGFLGIALLWGSYAFFLDQQNDSILAIKIGELFSGLGPIALLLVAALISGITGGLAAMTGSLGWQLFKK